jgi:hypothetical protein
MLVFLPVSAAQVSYSSAGIEYYASAGSGSELVPGTETQFTVQLINNAQYQVVASQATLQPEYDVATAYQLRVALEDMPGITVKTGAQTVASLAPGETASLTYTVSVDKYASPGPRAMNLHVVYNELFSTEYYGDAIGYTWVNNREKDVPLSVSVQNLVAPDVVSVSGSDINVGTSGFLTLEVQNGGGMNAVNAYAVLVADQTAVIAPVEKSVFIGDFPAGSTKTVTFKVSVATNAEVQEYPVGMQIVYEDDQGVDRQSGIVIVGVPVNGKVQFKVTDVEASLAPGQKGPVRVTYQNTGDTTVYSATARLSAVDPFSSNDDSAYLGDLGPGESAVGVYEVTVDGSATVKSYGLDTEIRYRDANDNSILSKSMKAVFDVHEREGSFFTSPLFIILVLAVIVIGGYYVFMKRKGKV